MRPPGELHGRRGVEGFHSSPFADLQKLARQDTRDLRSIFASVHQTSRLGTVPAASRLTVQALRLFHSGFDLHAGPNVVNGGVSFFLFLARLPLPRTLPPPAPWHAGAPSIRCGLKGLCRYLSATDFQADYTWSIVVGRRPVRHHQHGCVPSSGRRSSRHTSRPSMSGQHQIKHHHQCVLVPSVTSALAPCPSAQHVTAKIPPYQSTPIAFRGARCVIGPSTNRYALAH